MKTAKEKRETARIICADLSSRYTVKICDYDKTAIVVSDITEKQLTELCRELHCSGIYSDTVGRGIITNFGEYN